MRWTGSPVSDDGRGLKLDPQVCAQDCAVGSPVSDDGRGLKRQWVDLALWVPEVRPSVMTGAD